MFGCQAVVIPGVDPVEQQASVANLLLPAGLADSQAGIGTRSHKGGPLVLQVEVKVTKADALGRFKACGYSACSTLS